MKDEHNNPSETYKRVKINITAQQEGAPTDTGILLVRDIILLS